MNSTRGRIVDIIIVTLLMLLVFCSFAHGQYLKMRVTAVRGENNLPQAQVKRIAQATIREINDKCWTGIRLNKFEVRKNPFPHMGYSLSDARPLIGLWEGWYHKKGSKADVNVAVIGPFIVRPTYWLLGYASGTCDRYGTAYSTAEPKNAQGYDRVVHSATAFKHEVLHLLGASHQQGDPLMDPDALSKLGNSIPTINDYSQWEVVNCEGRWKR